MSGTNTLPLVLTMGDPAGCGPQISHGAWSALREGTDCFFVAGSVQVLEQHGSVVRISTAREARDAFRTGLPVLDTGYGGTFPLPGQPQSETASGILASIRTAVRFVRDGEACALVTNPINKALLYGEGFGFAGHTEYLAALCADESEKAPHPVMMLVGGGLKVALATIHQPLVQAAQSLSVEGLVRIGEIVDAGLKRDFGLPAPRLAFSGLNPHAGESGTIGHEEVEIINPAAAMLRSRGIDISDARSADTLFAETLDGKFDAVIAMTHDQGLIPVKTLDFWGGVNVTLGLPIIRTSPDHGTAYEAAASGNCRADSLIAAIRLAAANARHRNG